MSSVYGLLGETDNFSEPKPGLNRQPAIYGLILSFLILSTLCAIWRLWIRCFVTRVPGLDDVFVVLAVLCNFAQAVGLCLACKYGLGQHFLLLGLSGMRHFMQTFYIANGAYPVSGTFIKLALLFQYLRLFRPGTRLRAATIITIVVVCAWGAAFSFLSWVPCIPVHAYWDWNIPDYQVTRYGFSSHDHGTFVATYLTHAASNMMLDLVIFMIPVPLYMDRAIQTRTRWALCGLFVLGAIVNVCSICRFVSLVKTRAATYPTLDPSWYGSVPSVLSALEVHLATICASMPVFWPVIKQNLGRIMVTREVDVRRETRDFGTISDFTNNGDDNDMFVLEAVGSKQKHYVSSQSHNVILSQIDPLRKEKPTTTTVMALGQQPAGVKHNNKPLDLGLDVKPIKSLAGLSGHRSMGDRKDSKEVLLEEQ